MGYNTKFSGTIFTEPQMDWTMRAAIREYCANADVGKVRENSDLDGTCDWKPSDTDFSGLIHNGMEKSYDQDKWLRALINDLLKPAGFVCNGVIECQGEQAGDIWRIYVRDNEVTRDDLAPGAVWEDQYVSEPSYAEKVNAPLTEDTVTALDKELTSGNIARYRRARYPQQDAELFTAAQADEALNALRARLHNTPPEPEPAPSMSSVGAALRDLGNAIAFKATQGVDAVASFVTDIEGALELCTEQGDMAPLDALFKSLRDEHDAEAEQAAKSAAVDDDIPSEGFASSNIDPPEGYGIPEEVKAYVREQLEGNRGSQAALMILQAVHDDDVDALEERTEKLNIPEFTQGLDDAWRLAAANIAKASLPAPAPKLTAEDVTSRYLMTLDQAQEMIDGGAIESGGILFVNEAARDEFAAWVKADRETAEAEHEAAWKKIHAEQAEEEKVREQLRYYDTHDSVTGQDIPDLSEEDEAAAAATLDKAIEDGTAGYTVAPPERRFLDDDNLETWDRESRQTPGKTIKEVIGADIPPSLWDSLDSPNDHLWMIWSNKYSLWWMPNSVGYTEHPGSAGRFTLEQATAIVLKSCRGWDPAQSSVPPTTIVPEHI
jgi:hypothetical protein